MLYILMCATGVGFSVEEQYVNKFPELPGELRESDTTIVVEDSKIGWAVGLRQLLNLLYAGTIPKFDLSKLRPAGARLKTFGGRSSGPEPLRALFNFIVHTFQGAKGRKLTTLEVHDIACKIADVVVVGGVRRSALISLSDQHDERLRHAKDGAFWERFPYRGLSNNSAVYNERPPIGVFMNEWRSLYESGTGERGIFNRASAKSIAKSNGRRDADHEFGTNPCGEIILRPSGLCNLSEVVVRHGDTLDEIKRKVQLATILGTFQSTLTNFRYLRKIWQRNAEEERLLGVSLTGIMDHAELSGPSIPTWAEELKKTAIATNIYWAEKLGINQSVAITTIKPSGTVSQLVNSSSGIHPRHSKYYLRSVRADNKDPLCIFMKEKGFPHEPDITKPEYNTVFYFPIASPDSSVFRGDRSALEQLECYLHYKRHWCEHNPSITVYIKESEWMDVGAWVYRNFDSIGGIAFLPYDGGNYEQAPYQELTEAAYLEWCNRIPTVDFKECREETDGTTSTQDLACMSGVCEI